MTDTLTPVPTPPRPFPAQTSDEYTALCAAIVSDSWGEHTSCSLTACRAPLHPGPCKGWKHTLHQLAPGVWHSLERTRVENLNKRRVAAVAKLRAEGKPVPKALLTPIEPRPGPAGLPPAQHGQIAKAATGPAHEAAVAAHPVKPSTGPAEHIAGKPEAKAEPAAPEKPSEPAGKPGTVKATAPGTPGKIPANPIEPGRTLDEQAAANVAKRAAAKLAATDAGEASAKAASGKRGSAATRLGHYRRLTPEQFHALPANDRANILRDLDVIHRANAKENPTVSREAATLHTALRTGTPAPSAPAAPQASPVATPDTSRPQIPMSHLSTPAGLRAEAKKLEDAGHLVPAAQLTGLAEAVEEGRYRGDNAQAAEQAANVIERAKTMRVPAWRQAAPKPESTAAARTLEETAAAEDLGRLRRGYTDVQKAAIEATGGGAPTTAQLDHLERELTAGGFRNLAPADQERLRTWITSGRGGELGRRSQYLMDHLEGKLEPLTKEDVAALPHGDELRAEVAKRTTDLVKAQQAAVRAERKASGIPSDAELKKLPLEERSAAEAAIHAARAAAGVRTAQNNNRSQLDAIDAVLARHPETTPEQRRILDRLRSNYVHTLRAKAGRIGNGEAPPSGALDEARRRFAEVRAEGEKRRSIDTAQGLARAIVAGQIKPGDYRTDTQAERYRRAAIYKAADLSGLSDAEKAAVAEDISTIGGPDGRVITAKLGTITHRPTSNPDVLVKETPSGTGHRVTVEHNGEVLHQVDTINRSAQLANARDKAAKVAEHLAAGRNAHGETPEEVTAKQAARVAAEKRSAELDQRIEDLGKKINTTLSEIAKQASTRQGTKAKPGDLVAIQEERKMTGLGTGGARVYRTKVARVEAVDDQGNVTRYRVPGERAADWVSNHEGKGTQLHVISQDQVEPVAALRATEGKRYQNLDDLRTDLQPHRRDAKAPKVTPAAKATPAGATRLPGHAKRGDLVAVETSSLEATRDGRGRTVTRVRLARVTSVSREGKVKAYQEAGYSGATPIKVEHQPRAKLHVLHQEDVDTEAALQTAADNPWNTGGGHKGKPYESLAELRTAIRPHLKGAKAEEVAAREAGKAAPAVPVPTHADLPTLAKDATDQLDGGTNPEMIRKAVLAYAEQLGPLQEVQSKGLANAIRTALRYDRPAIRPLRDWLELRAKLAEQGPGRTPAHIETALAVTRSGHPRTVLTHDLGGLDPTTLRGYFTPEERTKLRGMVTPILNSATLKPQERAGIERTIASLDALDGPPGAASAPTPGSLAQRAGAVEHPAATAAPRDVLRMAVDAPDGRQAAEAISHLSGKRLAEALDAIPPSHRSGLGPSSSVTERRRVLVDWATSADEANAEAVRSLGKATTEQRAARRAERTAARHAELGAPAGPVTPAPSSLASRVARGETTAPTLPHATPDGQRVIEAYEQILRQDAGRQPDNRFVGLERLRRSPLLRDMSRERLDAILKELDRDRTPGSPHVTIQPEANQKALTPADRAAALQMGGVDQHLIHIERRPRRG